MDLFKRIEVIRPNEFHDIAPTNLCSLWGSCFSTELANYLEDRFYSVLRSPFGVMYNPISMAKGLSFLLEGAKEMPDAWLTQVGESYLSFMHHSTACGECHSSEELRRRLETEFTSFRSRIDEVDLYVFTFGTAFVYEHTPSSLIVNNCHRLPSTLFTRKKITVENILQHWIPIIESLQKVSPGASILFTVSPIPHYRDSVRENTISKSLLHLAIDELCQNYQGRRVAYFPSYEIMREELRDYRFYQDDFAHPTPFAVSYIMERFGECYMKPIPKEWLSLHRQLQHRPLTTNPCKLKDYYQNLLERIHNVQRQHPYSQRLRDEYSRIKALLDHLSTL